MKASDDEFRRGARCGDLRRDARAGAGVLRFPRALLAAAAGPASAAPGYGYGRPTYGPPPGYGYGPGPGFGRISCGQGAQIVASQGFRRIAPRECQGRVYRYTAYQRGVAFEVRVSSSTGQITLVRQI